ncbi:hypothetical protein D3C86_1283720 [compost metagenome]
MPPAPHAGKRRCLRPWGARSSCRPRSIPAICPTPRSCFVSCKSTRRRSFLSVSGTRCRLAPGRPLWFPSWRSIPWKTASRSRAWMAATSSRPEASRCRSMPTHGHGSGAPRCRARRCRSCRRTTAATRPSCWRWSTACRIGWWLTFPRVIDASHAQRCECEARGAPCCSTSHTRPSRALHLHRGARPRSSWRSP